MPHQWWNTSAAAWGLLLLGIGVATVLTYVSPLIGIPIGVIICLAGIFLITRAYCNEFKIKLSLKKGGNKMLIGLGIAAGIVVVCIGGIIISQSSYVKATTVYCCTGDNTYQISAYNRGNATDTVFVTLGTSNLITDFKPLMGTSLPDIIEGGKNSNFITFKIEQLPPNVNLSYLVYVTLKAEQPYKFNAWSEATKSNISAKFTSQCPKPKIIFVDPGERAP